MRIYPSRILRVLALAALFTGGAAALAAQEAVEKEPNNTPGPGPGDCARDDRLGLRQRGRGRRLVRADDPGAGPRRPRLRALTAPAEVNIVLRFCDASGKALSDVDAFGSGEPEALVRLKQAPGKFLINVHTDRGADTEHPYKLRIYKYDRPPATAEEVRKALAKALDYLASTQQEDGSWPSHEIAGAGPIHHGLHRRRMRREGPFGPDTRRAGLSQVAVHLGLSVPGGFRGRRPSRAGCSDPSVAKSCTSRPSPPSASSKRSSRSTIRASNRWPRRPFSSSCAPRTRPRNRPRSRDRPRPTRPTTAAGAMSPPTPTRTSRSAPGRSWP